VKGERSEQRFLALRAVSFAGAVKAFDSWLLPAQSVRWSARSTQVERTLREHFRLWSRSWCGSGVPQFDFFAACAVVSPNLLLS